MAAQPNVTNALQAGTTTTMIWKSHTHTHTYQSVHFQKTKAEILNPGELMSLVTFDHC